MMGADQEVLCCCIFPWRPLSLSALVAWLVLWHCTRVPFGYIHEMYCRWFYGYASATLDVPFEGYHEALIEVIIGQTHRDTCPVPDASLAAPPPHWPVSRTVASRQTATWRAWCTRRGSSDLRSDSISIILFQPSAPPPNHSLTLVATFILYQNASSCSALPV